MRLIEQLPTSWIDFLNLEKTYFDEIEKKISGEELNPKKEKIFAAFNIKPEEVKVVIIGQDPYPDPENANGLAFSIDPNINKLPPTLRNIKKELSDDLGIELSQSGDLSSWVNSGVLLLNRILTTRKFESLAHQNFGWENFTDLVIHKLSEKSVVFLLWSKYSQQVSKFIKPENQILGAHPSPLSAYRGFFGSKPFSKVNDKLKEKKLSPIDWRI